jgi:hypothetical protein
LYFIETYYFSNLLVNDLRIYVKLISKSLNPRTYVFEFQIQHL